MHVAGLTFVFVNGLLVRLPFLLDTAHLSLGIPLAVLALRFSTARIFGVVLISAVLTSAVLEKELDRRIEITEQDVPVEGQICSLPTLQAQVTVFMLCLPDGVRYRLTWYRPDEQLRPGQHWRFNVKLGKPTGSVNFDLFDYERWQFVKRIHGRGYIRSEPPPELLREDLRAIDSRRFHLRSILSARLPANELSTFLALSLGDTSLLDQSHWRLLNATGTTHLLIVSGLHVGLIAGLTFVLLRFVGLPLHFVTLMTIAIAGVYALLAGSGLPVQRAWIMTSVVLLCLSSARQIGFGAQLLIALVGVVAFDPLATLSNGFWLSFSAVAVLLFFLSGSSEMRGVRAKLGSAVCAQWVVYLGLAVPLAVLMQQIPLVSFAVNLIAIPWVGLVIVPILLTGLALLPLVDSVANELLMFCGWQVFLLWEFLKLAVSFELTAPISGLPMYVYLMAALGAMILLLPKGIVPRWPGLILLLSLFQKPEPLAAEVLRLVFLDVGQGLAVIVETTSQVVVYDTGPAFDDRYSAAAQVIKPTLQQIGRSQIDHLVLSHGDNDHAGGKDFLVEHLLIHQVHEQGDCNAGWRSGKTRFRVFSNSTLRHGKNNNSCLLMVEHGDQRILLTGDIEEVGEYALLRHDLGWFNLISAPHHGSDSSSTPALLNRLLPEMIVVSAGHENRFGHPHANVISRYTNRSIRTFNTANDGAVRFYFDGNDVTVTTARAERPALWRRNEH